MSRENLTKRSLTMRLVSLVVLGVLGISVFFITPSVAKYIASGGGLDSARVAKVFVSVTDEPIADEGETASDYTVDFTDENIHQQKITVSNYESDSKVTEVSMYYTVIVELPAEFPQVTVNLTGATLLNTEIESATIDPDNQTVTFAGVTTAATVLKFSTANQFAAGVKGDFTHTLTITGTENIQDLYENREIKISVKAEQID